AHWLTPGPEPSAPSRPPAQPDPDVHVTPGIERVDVRERTRRAVPARTVLVRGHDHAQVLVAVLVAPFLRRADEEPLLAGEPIDDRRRLAVERRLVGLEGDRKAAEIPDVLAEREIALHMEARQRPEGAELAR